MSKLLRHCPSSFAISITLLSGPSFADESQFLPGLRAYNAIPNPDETKVAFVATGWGHPSRPFGVGPSSLRSEVRVSDLEGNLLPEVPLADTFLAGWTPDGGYRNEGAASVCPVAERQS